MTLSFILGHLSVFLANTLFGLNIPITKILLSEWITPTGYMTLRSAGALLLFFLSQCFMGQEKVAPRDLLKIAAGGLVGFGISQYTNALSLQYTTPVYVSMVIFMTPMLTMFLAALLLGESLSVRKIVGVVLSIGGAAIMIWHVPANSNGSNHLLGIALAFLSIIAFSLYLISMRAVARKYSPVTQTKWVFFFTFIFMAPIGFHNLDEQKLLSSAWEWSGVLCMLYVIIFATFISYILMPFGMRHLNATSVSVYFNVQPIVATLVAIAFGQDSFKPELPLAAVLVLAGAYIVSTARQAQSPSKSQSQSQTLEQTIEEAQPHIPSLATVTAPSARQN